MGSQGRGTALGPGSTQQGRTLSSWGSGQCGLGAAKEQELGLDGALPTATRFCPGLPGPARPYQTRPTAEGQPGREASGPRPSGRMGRARREPGGDEVTSSPHSLPLAPGLVSRWPGTQGSWGQQSLPLS